MAKAKGKTRTHRAVPHAKITKLWAEGKSYEQIAKAIDRYDEKADDPTKPTRAIISRMLTVGYTDENGKVLKLKPRQGMRNIGVGKTVHTGKAAKVLKTPKAPKAKKVKASKGKPGRKPGTGAVLIEATENGGVIRVTVGGKLGLVPAEKAKVQLINVLDSMGLAVVPKDTQVVAPATAVAETVLTATVAEVPAPAPTTEDKGGDNVLETDVTHAAPAPAEGKNAA